MHAADLDPAVRAQLRSLPESIADNVARHLVMADRIFADDPERGYRYAVAAREIASRVAAVRAFCGVAAYSTGRWADALSELRAARRMSGEDTYLPLMADAERGLGRPERALDLARSPEADRLDRAERIELRIVESGARRDLGQYDAAVVALQVQELKDPQRRPWTARLYYAYADALLDAGREDDARLWFARAAEADRTGETDAHDRFTALEGADVFDAESDEVDILDAESDTLTEQPDADLDEDDEGPDKPQPTDPSAKKATDGPPADDADAGVREPAPPASTPSTDGSRGAELPEDEPAGASSTGEPTGASVEAGPATGEPADVGSAGEPAGDPREAELPVDEPEDGGSTEVPAGGSLGGDFHAGEAAAESGADDAAGDFPAPHPQGPGSAAPGPHEASAESRSTSEPEDAVGEVSRPNPQERDPEN